VALPPLASVADVQLLHGPVPDEELDKVRALLDQASGAVRRYCRQTWASGDVPADLSGLVAAKVAGALAGSGANPGGLRSLQTGAMSETYSNSAGTVASLGAAALTEEERSYLRAAGYRRAIISVQMVPF
jgi:hypothetical protein